MILAQIKANPSRNAKNPVAMLIRAIENGYAIPDVDAETSSRTADHYNRPTKTVDNREYGIL